MRHALRSLVLVPFLAAFPDAAGAAPGLPHAMWVDGNVVLAEIDRRATPFDDQSYTATMQIIKGGKVKKTLAFNSVMKGLEKQYIEFTSPGDVAGMKVLMVDATTLYLYSKEFGKVRKVAAHAVKQGFMGGEFTYEDMTQVRLSPFYDAEVAGKEGARTTLVLKPKAGVPTLFAKLEVVVDAGQGGVTTVRYFDSSGTQVREQQRGDWSTIEGHPVPTKVSMRNLKTGDLTVITLGEFAVNQGVDESMFSRRQLLRG